MPNIWIILIIVTSSLIKGITGFGFALISFPLLLMWYAPKEIIPVLMICNLIASILIILQKKEHKLINKQSFLLIGSGGLFTIVGVYILSAFDVKMLIHISGVLFIALTLYSLKKRELKDKKIPDYNYLVAGSLIGFITGVISVSGPPLALFLNRANISNRKFREIFAWFSVVSAIIAILGYFQTGLLSFQTLQAALLFTPILLVGTIIGKKLSIILSNSKFQTINIVLTLISSLLMLII